jgi:hypothetical protein
VNSARTDQTFLMKNVTFTHTGQRSYNSRRYN